MFDLPGLDEVTEVVVNEEAVSSEISDEDARELDPGPVYPVFDVSSE